MTVAGVAGLGLLVLPLFIVRAASEAGAPVRLDLTDESVPDGACAVYRPTRSSSAKVRAFIDHLAEALSSEAV